MSISEQSRGIPDHLHKTKFPRVDSNLTKDLVIVFRFTSFEGSLRLLEFSTEGSDIGVGTFELSLFNGRLEVRY